MKKEKTKPEHYCSNKELHLELRKYKDTGVISEELGQMFINIATRYVNKRRFYGYTEKSDWANDAVLRMIQQIDKIDLNHPKCNAFSYLTSLTHNKIISNKDKLLKRLDAKKQLADVFLDEIEQNVKIQKQIRYNDPF